MSTKKDTAAAATPDPGEALVAPALKNAPVPDPANTPVPGEALPPPSSIKAPDSAVKEHAGEPAPGVPDTSPSRPPVDAAEALAAADTGKARTAYQMKENGRTTGPSGTEYAYAAGEVVEAPDGDLDHLGTAAVKYQTRIVVPED